MRRRFVILAIGAVFVTVVVVVSVIRLMSAGSGLDQTGMSYLERQVTRCGGIYYILVAASSENLAPNLKELALTHAKKAGASEAQLIILADRFDRQEYEMRNQGFRPGMAPNDEEKKELSRLASLAKDACTGTAFRFP